MPQNKGREGILQDRGTQEMAHDIQIDLLGQEVVDLGNKTF